ncbi:translation initiation factor IF-3 [Nonomuraea salmonea]|uniref:translation initiation factor IF-3 n=1 Tax=Nonomuraea salmonea TaxID=46181 RepID=UPI003CD07F3F
MGPNGEQVGIVSIHDALKLAQEADLDLVEVAATARPPVCKLMDYGKFKYESAMKAREARKNQAHTIIKEIKLRPKIDPHDYETKKGHVVRFLKAGGQGQSHDHVPRARAVPAGARFPAAAAAGGRRPGARLRGVPRQAGRP